MGLNVLSLFDGISCGRLALARANIKVNKYYSSEIDKFAITVAQANFPDNILLGDVTKWREWDIKWESIDLLIGGSPCQGFSSAGGQLNFNDPRSKLFFEYIEILNHLKSVNPNIKFLLENVKMKKEWLDKITSYVGVEPVFINSNLVSAQNRQRYYWCNWNIEQPEDKCKYLESIIDTSILKKQESNSIWFATTRRDKNNIRLLRGKGQKSSTIVARYSAGIRGDGRPFIYSGNANNGDKFDFNNDDYRPLTPLECERLQTLPDHYTELLSKTQRYKTIGNGWTVDVIAHIFSSLYCKK